MRLMLAQPGFYFGYFKTFLLPLSRLPKKLIFFRICILDVLN
jgi:hypothetical protein